MAAGIKAGASERDLVEAFVASIQERRALCAPAERLTESDTKISVAKIYRECSAYLSAFPEEAHAVGPIGKIDEACRRFVRSEATRSFAEFYMTLGALRAVIVEQIASLSAAYMVGDAVKDGHRFGDLRAPCADENPAGVHPPAR
jgi:hypothetical protein